MSTFNGKITEISDIRTGTNNGKEWASLEFEVTELNPNNPQYPQIGLFGYFKNGEYVKYAKEFKDNFKTGDEVTVDFNLKRIDYQKDGEDKKFYKTEAWRVTKLETVPDSVQAAAQAIDKVMPPEDLDGEDNDLLPF